MHIQEYEGLQTLLHQAGHLKERIPSMKLTLTIPPKDDSVLSYQAGTATFFEQTENLMLKIAAHIAELQSMVRRAEWEDDYFTKAKRKLEGYKVEARRVLQWNPDGSPQHFEDPPSPFLLQLSFARESVFSPGRQLSIQLGVAKEVNT